MTDPTVTVDGVSKWFGSLVAVSDVSFEIGSGVTALLGPNGSGKSTLLRMLCGLARPSSGSVLVNGRNPRVDLGVTREIGLAPQQETVFEQLTARAFVRLTAVLQRLPDPDAAAVSALETVELDPADGRKLPTYSKGMRQRVKLAQAIVHSPSVIVLDEPLSGLDPRQQLHMIDLFHRLGSGGRCVIVASHVLEEVSRFGSNVLVLVRTTRPQFLAGELMRAGVAVGARIEESDRLVLDTEDARSLARALAPAARAQDASVLEVRPVDEDLEDVFRYLVER